MSDGLLDAAEGFYKTDPQTPATEAGRRLLMASHDGAALELGDIIAIEAEARATVKLADYEEGEAFGYAKGRADALREARLRFADAFMRHPTGRMNDMEVLAILAERER